MIKNQTVFEYCNIGEPYLKITAYNGKGIVEYRTKIDFSESHLEDGAISDVQYVATQVTQHTSKVYPITLVLSVSQIIKKSLTLPKMKESRAVLLNKQEMKAHSKIFADYTAITKCHKHDLGYIFSNYYIPKNIINSFALVAKLLHTRIRDVMLMGDFLAQNLAYNVNYVYFYIRSGAGTVFLADKSELITAYDFPVIDMSDVLRTYILVITKHEFDYERKKLKYFAEDSDMPFTFDTGLVSLDANGVPTVGVEGDEEQPALVGFAAFLAKLKGILHKPKQEELPPEVNSEPVVDSTQQPESVLQIEFDDPDTDESTTFRERLMLSSETVKLKYRKICSYLLAYKGMKSKETKICTVFYIDNHIYAKVDVRGQRIYLYLPVDPMKYYKTKYESALSKKKDFLDTPCLYRISTQFRMNGAYQLISELAKENGLSKRDI